MPPPGRKSGSDGAGMGRCDETTGGTATAPFRKAGMGSRCRKVREKISSLLQDGR